MENELSFTQQLSVPETSFATPKTPPPDAPPSVNTDASLSVSTNRDEFLNFTQPFHFQTPADSADDSAINATQAFEFQTPSSVKVNLSAANHSVDDVAKKTKLDLNFDLAGPTQDFGSPTPTTTEHEHAEPDLQGATQDFQTGIAGPVAVDEQQHEDSLDEIQSLASDDNPDDPLAEHSAARESTALKIVGEASNDEDDDGDKAARPDDSTTKGVVVVVADSPTDLTVDETVVNDDHDDDLDEDLSFKKRSKTVRRRISDDDDDDDDAEDEEVDKASKNGDAATGSPLKVEPDNEPASEQHEEEQEEKKSEVGELIADIFGDSDDDETAAGKASRPDVDEGNDDEVSTSNNLPDNKDDDLYQGEEDEEQQVGDDEQEGDDDDTRLEVPQDNEDFVSDFELMMEKRRKQSQRWRKRRGNYEFISYNDDNIAELLSQMKLAAKEDIDLNSMQMPATRKRTLLPITCRELRKADLVSGFIEAGIVGVMAQWLSPLPDKSLPALEIRTDFLKLLLTFPTLDHQILRSSNIGKSVMLLLKHPKETKENKERARKLINEWARPIFNLQTDYRSLSKDERIKRDYDHMPVAKKRRMSLEGEQPSISSKPTEQKTLGPGDKGFIGRARVPRPSTKDYVVRPKWNVETEFRNNGNKKQAASKMDKKIREIKMKTAPRKTLHAVGVSLEGRKMAM